MKLLIREQLCPTSKYGLKAPYQMKPEFITIHNTANDASAKSEVSFMLNNNTSTSFHIAVDDKEAIIAVPLNRNAFHAGDGNGLGNRTSIGIEICYSKSGGARFDKAEENAAYLVATMLHERGWGIDKVRTHKSWSGKYCPHRTLDKGWDRFLNMIRKELAELEAPKLTANGIYIQSNDDMGIVAGLVTDAQDKNNIEYSWYVSIDCENWAQLEDWETGDEWLRWKPVGYGSYVIVGKARRKGSNEIVSSYTTVEYHPVIKGTCFIPKDNLLGVETYGNLGYEYEIMVYDCIRGAWIYTTGRCLSEDTSFWTSLNLENGYYWGLFRIYDGFIIDEKCVGFGI